MIRKSDSNLSPSAAKTDALSTQLPYIEAIGVPPEVPVDSQSSPFPPELNRVVAPWDMLLSHIRRAILALVLSASTPGLNEV